MWDSQSHRGGMQKCSPVGYILQGIAVWLRLLALLLLFIVIGYLVLKAFNGEFLPAFFWWLVTPITVAVLAQSISMFGLSLAYQKEFEYNGEKREGSLLENGTRVKYNPVQDKTNSTYDITRYQHSTKSTIQII